MEVHSLSPETLQDVTSTGDATFVAAEDISRTFSDSIDLLSSPLGTRVLSFSDEFFAEASNLTNPSAPIHRPGVYVSTGAWYDGWETRRHNPQPFDFVIFRLGVASGTPRGVEIDTGFFNGNHAPEISVEGCFRDSDAADKEVQQSSFTGWDPILHKQECGPACRQAWRLPTSSTPVPVSYTHIRLRMYPDGGIARIRLFGIVRPILPTSPTTTFDLAATVNGGVATSCSDQHFGVKDNILLPGRGKDMGDGWETKRSRGDHVDWVVVRLGCAGAIDRLVVDTKDFKGNFPREVRLSGASAEHEPNGADDAAWTPVLAAPQRCRAHAEHVYEGDALVGVAGVAFRWVRMVIVPDGGVKRLRVFGRRAA